MAVERAAGGTSLIDVLDRVLDKGLVIAGDIKVSLAEVELLTIRVRLIICSIDKAQQIGLDWWRYDQHLAPGRKQVELERERVVRKITGKSGENLGATGDEIGKKRESKSGGVKDENESLGRRRGLRSRV